MKKTILSVLMLALMMPSVAQQLLSHSSILEAMNRANDYFIRHHPDPTAPTFVKKERPSNLWTRGVYFEGLEELNRLAPQAANVAYMNRWGNFHRFTPRNGVTTRDADDYCCSQAFLDMYVDSLDKFRELGMILPTTECMNNLLRHAKDKDEKGNTSINDWTWVDAIQMGLPVLCKLARIQYLQGDTIASNAYAEQGWRMYQWTRDSLAGGLFNKAEGLWWRDKDFVPPYKSPNGQNCYWSRGNGWVYAALVRAMDADLMVHAAVPPAYREPTGCAEWRNMGVTNHFEDYLADFLTMTEALVRCQRRDHFWNVDLLDETNFGGKELTGTALFVYGMAWGVRHGYLPRPAYLPLIAATWKAMVKECLHKDGFLGYVQGTGKQPSDSQPVGYDIRPDFDDFGLGCFLLAGAEVYQLVK